MASTPLSHNEEGVAVTPVSVTVSYNEEGMASVPVISNEKGVASVPANPVTEEWPLGLPVTIKEARLLSILYVSHIEGGMASLYLVAPVSASPSESQCHLSVCFTLEHCIILNGLSL